MSRFSLDQPDPIVRQAPSVELTCWEKVIRDAKYYKIPNPIIDLMQERNEIGIERYNTPLMPHNGRDAGSDAMCETLDLLAYLQQIKLERPNDVDLGYLDLFYQKILDNLPLLYKYVNKPK